jgi:hypothetical protein
LHLRREAIFIRKERKDEFLVCLLEEMRKLGFEKEKKKIDQKNCLNKYINR